jgi:hypothetical protein
MIDTRKLTVRVSSAAHGRRGHAIAMAPMAGSSTRSIHPSTGNGQAAPILEPEPPPVTPQQNGGATEAKLEPDRDQIEMFVNAVFRYASTGYFSVRSFYENDLSRKPFRIKDVQLSRNRPLIALVDLAEHQARLAAQEERPTVCCALLATFNNLNNWQAREEDLVEGLTITVECDAYPQRARQNLEAILGPATVVVKSGGIWINPETGEGEDKLHLYWRMAVPAIGKGNLAKLKEARALACKLVSADGSSDSIVHPIRWPGSWHRKKEPRLCEIIELNAGTEIDLDTALAKLQAEMPKPEPRKPKPEPGGGEPKPELEPGPEEPDEDDDTWNKLVADIISGKCYHVPLTKLASRCVGAGMFDGQCVKLLRSIMHASIAPRDDRWQTRYDSISRYVREAREKYGRSADWQEPDLSLLEDSRGKLPTFPLDCLPTAWQPWVTRTAHGSGTTPAHVAMSLMGLASGVIGVARQVQVVPTWVEPMAMWMALVGKSGSGKTPALEATKRGLREVNKLRRPMIKKLRHAHEERSGRAKIILKNWEKDTRDAMKAGMPLPQMPDDADDPGPFVEPVTFVSDSTVERLAMLLKARPCGIIHLRDELAGLFLNLSRYHDGSDREFYLESWNGKSFRQERVSRKPIDLDHLMVAIYGNITPDKLKRAFEGDHDGMYARIMFAWPEEASYQKLRNDIPAFDVDLVNAFSRLVKLGDPDQDGIFAPRNIEMSLAAWDLFETYRKDNSDRRKELDGREREWLVKAQSHIVRLAGTLTMLDWALAGGDEPKEIGTAYVAAAIKLVMEYFWPHTRAALRLIKLSDEETNVRPVLRWIKANGLHEVSREDIRREALHQNFDAASVDAVIEELERGAWLRKIIPPKTTAAGPPRIRWEVNPKLFETEEGAQCEEN